MNGSDSLPNGLIRVRIVAVVQKCGLLNIFISKSLIQEERMNMKFADTLRRYYVFGIQILTKNRILDLAYNYMDAYFHKQDLLWLKIKSVEDYCIENKESVMEIESSCDRIVYRPPYFQLCDGEEHHFRSPSIYVAVLHGVFSLGGAIA